MTTFCSRPSTLLRFAFCATFGLLPACSADRASNDAPTDSLDSLFVTSTIVFNEEGQNTYVSLLPSLDDQEIDLAQAREFPGWSSSWSHDGKLFLADGEAPVITRYSVDDAGTFGDEGKVSFLDHGAQFADTLFVGANKAYVFAEDGAVWEPRAMEIVDSFSIPTVENREGGLEYSGLRTGRSTVVRGNRAYIATSWANWEAYDVAEDSAIVVVDTDSNEIIDTLPVACPYIDVASLDEDGTVYFSNWVYSVGPTLLSGKAKACAVRILPEQDRIDLDWSLTFADVTEGREGAALRALGNGQALISVFHDERAEQGLDPAALADSPNWRFWTLDLKTLAASPIEDIGFHAGGFNTARIDDRNFLMVPSGDYETTATYEILPNGSAQKRWESNGWSTELLQLR